MRPDLTNQSKEGLWDALQVITIELATTYNILALALGEPTLGVPSENTGGVVELADQAADFIISHRRSNESY